MARTNRPQRRRPCKPQVHHWEDYHEMVFSLASATWARPAVVQVRATQRGGTFVATFTREDGQPIRLTTRVALSADRSSMKIIDERLAATFRYGGAA